MTAPGKRRRILLHPLLVTVPIGCWVTSLVFDIASRLVADPGFLARASYWLIGIGLIGAIVAGIAGFADLMPVPPGSKAHRVAVIHLSVVMLVLLLYGISYLMRAAGPLDRPVPLPLIALAVAGVLAVGAAAVLGNLVAHRHAAGHG